MKVSHQPRLTPMKRTVLRALRDFREQFDGRSPCLDELATLVRRSRYTVRDHLHALLKLNLVWHEHAQRDWEPTPEGLDVLDEEDGK